MDEAFMLRKTSPNPSPACGGMCHFPRGELCVQLRQWGGRHEFPFRLRRKGVRGGVDSEHYPSENLFIPLIKANRGAERLSNFEVHKQEQ
jgi:hypothetical protein